MTFWVYLETRSVFATGMIAGIFLVAIARHRASGSAASSTSTRRRRCMQASAAGLAVVMYAARSALYLLTPDEAFRDPGSVLLWVFVVMVMLGVIAGNLRHRAADLRHPAHPR